MRTKKENNTEEEENRGRNWFPRARFYSGIFKLVYLKRTWMISLFLSRISTDFSFFFSKSGEKCTLY